MNVFGVGLPEMVLILVLALLVFGPKKLPEIGRSLGKALKGFQEASKEFEEEFKKEAQQLEKVVTSPMKASLESEPPKALTPQTESTPPEVVVVAEPESAPSSEAASEVVVEASQAEESESETLS
ncbi:MAG TPA: TatA/E family twin arginine-targeting protein translocase [Leptolyngbyaceae cyanobacterium M65_K2018_010]|nr:TatA/E family twin arginine-targeting protein translocase [Leptolyngbyaceae cyanobacterium M65_K2018_010]